MSVIIAGLAGSPTSGAIAINKDGEVTLHDMPRAAPGVGLGGYDAAAIAALLEEHGVQMASTEYPYVGKVNPGVAMRVGVTKTQMFVGAGMACPTEAINGSSVFDFFGIPRDASSLVHSVEAAVRMYPEHEKKLRSMQDGGSAARALLISRYAYMKQVMTA